MNANPKRVLFLVLGWISLVLGVIGALLPILPSVPFAILAAYFFSKSSPRLHAWLLRQPYLGPAIKDWQENRCIRPLAKLSSVTFIVLGMSYPILFRDLPTWIKALLAVTAIAVLSFILSRPSGPARE